MWGRRGILISVIQTREDLVRVSPGTRPSLESSNPYFLLCWVPPCSLFPWKPCLFYAFIKGTTFYPFVQIRKCILPCCVPQSLTNYFFKIYLIILFSSYLPSCFLLENKQSCLCWKLFACQYSLNETFGICTGLLVKRSTERIISGAWGMIWRIKFCEF